MARRDADLKPRGVAAGSVGRTPEPGGFEGGWLWIFPLAYLVHAVEEVWAGEGYAAWVSRLRQQPLSDAALISIHAVLLAALIVAIAVVWRWQRFRWLVVGFALIYVGNAGLHAVVSWTTESYSPGLITGVSIWLPLGVLAGLRAARRLPARDLAWGAVVGVVGTVVISLLALNPGLIPLL